MSTASQLLRELEHLAGSVGAVLLPERAGAALDRIAEAAAIGFDAQAASIAVVDVHGGELEWRAAHGRGAAAMLGLQLPLNRGIAGYVASTGQSLSISDVRSDPRFAADVAERTQYVPTTIDCVPVEDPRGEVLGVLSILDANVAITDLGLAAALADAAAAAISITTAAELLGELLLDGLRDAARRGTSIAAMLRRRRGSRPSDDLLRLAAALAEARELGPYTQRTAVRVVDEVVALARRGRSG